MTLRERGIGIFGAFGFGIFGIFIPRNRPLAKGHDDPEGQRREKVEGNICGAWSPLLQRDLFFFPLVMKCQQPPVCHARVREERVRDVTVSHYLP